MDDGRPGGTQAVPGPPGPDPLVLSQSEEIGVPPSPPAVASGSTPAPPAASGGANVRSTQLASIAVPNLLVLVGILALGWSAYPVIALYWFDAVIVLALAMPRLRAIRRAEGCPGLPTPDRNQLLGLWMALGIFAAFIFAGLAGRWVPGPGNETTVVDIDPLRHVATPYFLLALASIVVARGIAYLSLRSVPIGARRLLTDPGLHVLVLFGAIWLGFFVGRSADTATTIVALIILLGKTVSDVAVARGYVATGSDIAD